MRYIDADRLLNDLKADALYPLEKKRGIERVIDAQPTVDVVEVVRCRDCKWWKPFNDRMGHCGCDMKHKDQYCDRGKRAEI